MICTSVFAQLKAPTQTDTLEVRSIKYNYNDIKRDNWPFSQVLRTTTEFVFGNQAFKIERAEERFGDPKYGADEVRYYMEDGSVLSQYDRNGSIVIVFSGYELNCAISKQDLTPIENMEHNVKMGKIVGEPNARLKGRTVLGGLPSPGVYAVEREGIVVVQIWVNNYGEVTKAIAGAEGTTVTDKTLWAAARSAAMSTHFNMAADAPALQEGTITYSFK